MSAHGGSSFTGSSVADLTRHASRKCIQALSDAAYLVETPADRLLVACGVISGIAGAAAAMLANAIGLDEAKLTDVDRLAQGRNVVLAIADDMLQALPAGAARQALPTRRTGGKLDFQYGGINATFTAGWSCYPAVGGDTPQDAWRLAEVFINVDRSQSNLEKEVRDAGILASFALQHGASLDTLISGVTHEEDGTASSIIGTVLILVRDDIAARRRDGGTGKTETTNPGVPPAGGDGSAASGFGDAAKDGCAPEPINAETSRALVVAEPTVDPADSKEAGNDGDPVAAAHELWPLCPSCACRHAISETCPRAEAAARLAEDRRNTRVVNATAAITDDSRRSR